MASPLQSPCWFEKNNRTFFGLPADYKDSSKNDDKFVLGFTLRIVDTVRSRADGKQEGGWLCELKHMNHADEKYPCFISNSGSQNVRAFQNDLQSTPKLPPLLCHIEAKQLQSFIVWKNNCFAKYCKENGHPVDKNPVEHRNLQNDKKTYCFGPDLFMQKGSDSVSAISADRANYVWVSAYLKDIVPLQLYSRRESVDLIEVLRDCLEKRGREDTFLSFLLISAHTTILSLHYPEIANVFINVPSLVVIGPWTTGKTMSTESALAFLGTNAKELCIMKDSSLSALRDRYSKDRFPILIHDPNDQVAAVTAAQECYEGKAVRKHDGQWIPGTSVALTCNDSLMDLLQKRYEALTRCVVIPMMDKLVPFTLEEADLIEKAQECASFHFKNLLHINAADIHELRRRKADLMPPVAKAMQNLEGGANRVITNFAILIAATELFLEKVKYGEWKAKIQPFVLQKILPKAATFYKHVETKTARVSLQSQASVIDVRDAVEAFVRVVFSLHDEDPEELRDCFTIQEQKKCVAIREDMFLLLVQKHGKDTKVLEGLRRMEGFKGCELVSFKGTNRRAMQVPCNSFSDLQLAVLKHKQAPEDLAEPEEVSKPDTTMEVMSPFKKKVRQEDNESLVSSSPQIADVTSFEPEATSTQKSKGSSPSTPSSSQQGPVPVSSGPGTGFSLNTSKKVALPVKADGPTPSAQQTTKKERLNDKNICATCNVNEVTKEEKTYLCSQCKNRYHLHCEVEETKAWPYNGRLQRRACESCRNAAQH